MKVTAVILYLTTSCTALPRWEWSSQQTSHAMAVAERIGLDSFSSCSQLQFKDTVKDVQMQAKTRFPDCDVGDVECYCKQYKSDFTNNIVLNINFLCPPGEGLSMTRFLDDFCRDLTKPGNNPNRGEKPQNNKNNTSSNCDKHYIAATGDTCAKISTAQGIPTSHFIALNPSVGKNCDNLRDGHSYCVAAPSSNKKRTTTSSDMDDQFNEEPNYPYITAAALAPRDPGLHRSHVPDCLKWYLVKPGDTCHAIAAHHRIPARYFIKINPSVGKRCRKLWAGYKYCVRDRTMELYGSGIFAS